MSVDLSSKTDRKRDRSESSEEEEEVFRCDRCKKSVTEDDDDYRWTRVEVYETPFSKKGKLEYFCQNCAEGENFTCSSCDRDIFVGNDISNRNFKTLDGGDLICLKCVEK